MAYVINPDGTITTVEVEYDRNGNLMPKIDSELLNEQVIKYNSHIAPEGRISNVKQSAPIKKKSKVYRTIPPKKQRRFISTAEIDLFFEDRYASKKSISKEEYSSIINSLPAELREYFISRYRKPKGYKRVNDDLRKRKAFNKPKNKKKAIIEKETFFMVSSDSVIRESVDAVFASQGFRPAKTRVIPGVEAVMDLVAVGKGISVVPDTFLDSYSRRSELKILKLRTPFPHLNHTLLTHKANCPRQVSCLAKYIEINRRR